MDHVLRYEDTPGIKLIVVLGEVGVTPERLPNFKSVTSSLSFFFYIFLRQPDWRHR